LRQGALCPDGQWRKIIDIHDAIAGGCDLFDLEQLRLENSSEVFEQIYLCQFIDSTQSAFNLADLERCYSDQSLWTDYNPDPKAERPFGNAPVWNDIAAAFLTIKRGATTSGQITYSASRTDATGHADIAWAVMHALAHEPLNVHKKRRSRWSTLEGSHERSQATGHPHTPRGKDVQLRRARVGADRQPGRVHGRVRQRRRADLHPARVPHRPGQAAPRQCSPRHHPALQTQPAAA